MNEQLSLPFPRPRVVIFDIDNCISDDQHRMQLIDQSKFGSEKYAAYHKAHKLDAASPAGVEKVFEERSAGHELVFVTGRPSEHFESTVHWLKSTLQAGPAHQPGFALLMRPEGNELPSHKLKPMLLKLHSVAPETVVRAYDDLDSVLEAYRALGIPAQKLAIHTDTAARDDAAPSIQEDDAAAMQALRPARAAPAKTAA